ncbi:O-antigen ligase family protein [Adhaeribacter rhizoryzae]|nr:O-antigen ligase family protein [Adhaeribacter rhizoryzae]
MAAFRWTPSRQKLILNAFIFNILILSVVSFLKTYYKIFNGGLLDFKDVLGYDWAYFAFIMPEAVNVHAPYFSLYIGVALLFICRQLLNNFRSYSWHQKFGWLALLVYFLLFLAVLSSRTAIFATLFTLGIWVSIYLIRRGYTRYLIGIGATLLLILFAFYSNFPYLKKKIENRSGVSTRSYIWQAGNSIVKENILFGVGTGDIKDNLRAAYQKIGFEEGLTHTYNAHNQYLQTAIGLGAIGFIALLLIFFTLIAEALSTQNILLLAFVILFGLCCITESLLSRQHGIILFCFFSSILPIFENVPKITPARFSSSLK